MITNEHDVNFRDFPEVIEHNAKIPSHIQNNPEKLNDALNQKLYSDDGEWESWDNKTTLISSTSSLCRSEYTTKPLVGTQSFTTNKKDTRMKNETYNETYVECPGHEIIVTATCGYGAACPTCKTYFTLLNLSNGRGAIPYHTISKTKLDEIEHKAKTSQFNITQAGQITSRSNIDTSTTSKGATQEVMKNLKEQKSHLDNTNMETEYEDTVVPKIITIIPDMIYVGPHPFLYSAEKDLQFLRNSQIGAIVSAIEGKMNPNTTEGMDVFFVPTINGFTNDLMETCEFLDKMEKEQKPVFIHSFCSSRSGCILAAYLLYKRYLETIDEAIGYVRQYFDQSAIDTDFQLDYLNRFAARLDNNR
jgi:hypothetical protein